MRRRVASDVHLDRKRRPHSLPASATRDRPAALPRLPGKAHGRPRTTSTLETPFESLMDDAFEERLLNDIWSAAQADAQLSPGLRRSQSVAEGFGDAAVRAAPVPSIPRGESLGSLRRKPGQRPSAHVIPPLAAPPTHMVVPIRLDEETKPSAPVKQPQPLERRGSATFKSNKRLTEAWARAAAPKVERRAGGGAGLGSSKSVPALGAANKPRTTLSGGASAVGDRFHLLAWGQRSWG